jgi:hypothetical protein
MLKGDTTMKTCKDCFYFKKKIQLSIPQDAMTCGFEKLKYGLEVCEKFMEKKK